jgi:hypothetical protein
VTGHGGLAAGDGAAQPRAVGGAGVAACQRGVRSGGRGRREASEVVGGRRKPTDHALHLTRDPSCLDNFFFDNPAAKTKEKKKKMILVTSSLTHQKLVDVN